MSGSKLFFFSGVKGRPACTPCMKRVVLSYPDGLLCWRLGVTLRAESENQRIDSWGDPLGGRAEHGDGTRMSVTWSAPGLRWEATSAPSQHVVRGSWLSHLLQLCRTEVIPSV